MKTLFILVIILADILGHISGWCMRGAYEDYKRQSNSQSTKER